jgi:hypothetical protein
MGASKNVNYTNNTELDDYFTPPKIAEWLWKNRISKFDNENVIWVEPSAGSGVFYNLLPPDRRLGLDINPQCDGIFYADFFQWRLEKEPGKTYYFIGNPPYTNNGKSIWADWIKRSLSFASKCFYILPPRVLTNKGSLVEDLVLFIPTGSYHSHLIFDVQGEEKDVWCVYTQLTSLKFGETAIACKDLEGKRWKPEGFQISPFDFLTTKNFNSFTSIDPDTLEENNEWWTKGKPRKEGVIYIK